MHPFVLIVLLSLAPLAASGCLQDVPALTKVEVNHEEGAVSSEGPDGGVGVAAPGSDVTSEDQLSDSELGPRQVEDSGGNTEVSQVPESSLDSEEGIEASEDGGSEQGSQRSQDASEGLEDAQSEGIEDTAGAQEDDAVGAIDECSLGLDDCAFEAFCTDLEQGWSCECPAGYLGDGQTCEDIDECQTISEPCDANEVCINYVGIYTCACAPGYTWGGTLCVDLNECLDGDDDCHSDAKCTNTEGGWTCECLEGFVGDGQSCQPLGPEEPPALFLTMSRLPDYLNGSIPYFDAALGGPSAFFVRTSAENTCLDVAALESSGPIDWTSLTLMCDQAFTYEGGEEIAPGEVLELQGASSGEDGWRSACIAFTAPLVDTFVHCSASAKSPGQQVASAELSFLTTLMPPNLDPMGEPETWVLSYTRDIWSHTAPMGFLGITNTYVPQGNGLSDFDESMAAIGLMHLENEAMSTWARTQLQEAIKRHFEACFDPRGDGAIPLTVLNEGDALAPAFSSFSYGPRSSTSFSTLPIGGWDPLGDAVWGRCPYDPNNQRNEDVRSQANLGVMSAQIAHAILTSNMNYGYPSELVPQVGGTAFGADFADGFVLGPNYDPSSEALPERVAAFLYGVELVAAFTALVACHEVGHSLGLVPDGPPPLGLFGGVLGPSWVGEQTTSHHCEIGNNIMAAAVSIYDAYAQLSEPRVFSPLVEAYLRSEVVVGQAETNARFIFFAPFPNLVPSGVNFELCMDSSSDYLCQNGGQGGTITFYGAPANTHVSLELSAGPFATSLYNLYLYGGVTSPNEVFDYWTNVLEKSLVEELKEQAGAVDAPGQGTVWATILTRVEQQAFPGIDNLLVKLNGSSDEGYCVTSTEFASMVSMEEAMSTGASCEHVVFFNVPVGEHTLSIYDTSQGGVAARVCTPLAAWSNYGSHIASLEVAEGVLTRPILACE